MKFNFFIFVGEWEEHTGVLPIEGDGGNAPSIDNNQVNNTKKIARMGKLINIQLLVDVWKECGQGATDLEGWRF